MKQLLTKTGQPFKKFGNRYPWAQWFKKKYFVLHKGRDFEVALHGMLQMVRNYGWKRGYHVKMKSTETKIEVWVTPNGKNKEKK